MKVENVIFIDADKTAVKVFYDNGKIEVKSYNADDLEQFSLLNNMSEYEIERATAKFLQDEAEALQQYRKYIEDYESGLSVLGDVKSIISREYDMNDLFEMKLAAFELEEVKTSKDRKLKVSLRKAKDVFELFHIIHLLRTTQPEEAAVEEKPKRPRKTKTKPKSE